MTALALVLHLAVASPGLSAPLQRPLDPGPFQGSELAASSLGVLLGDALVLGSAYYTLQLFANGTFQPTAANFRTAAYSFGMAAIVIPPLTAVLLARWARAEPASGAAWKALLLATVGQMAALAAGYVAAPRFWVVIPAQMIAVGVGTTLGLHWGPRPKMRSAPAAAPDVRREPGDPAPDGSAAWAPALCPDPALASAAAG
ncbi:MAG TPA: hypothetical protein VF912_03280 [Anaeromyxobacter sp.]